MGWSEDQDAVGDETERPEEWENWKNKKIRWIRKFEEYVVQKFIDSIAIRQTKMKNEKNKIKYR